jgi:hypothetical protein
MPIEAPRYHLTRSMVAGAPEEPGVYALWKGEELIFLGRASQAATIRACLVEHLGGACPCTRQATHYTWELSLQPAAREAEVLREFQARFGRLPRCNGKAA